jgi:NitT/TauT family transport system substrate-binding protein
LLDEVLKPYGLTMADLEIINLPVPSVGAALADGSIAAASIAEPNITQYVQQGHSVLWYKAEEVTPSAVTGVLVFGPTILDDDREVGNRFMTAYLKGIRQYNEGKTERNLELIHSFTELDYETLEAMCFPSFSDDGRINFELGYATFQDWALAQGHIEGALTKDELIDESFVDFANQALEESAP